MIYRNDIVSIWRKHPLIGVCYRLKVNMPLSANFKDKILKKSKSNDINWEACPLTSDEDMSAESF